MKTIHVLSLREIRRMRGQIFTIALVISAGIASLSASIAAYRSLEAAQRKYYLKNRFADIFVDIKAAPHSIVKTVEQIPGVMIAEPRISFLVRLDLPDVPELGMGQFISVPDGKAPKLNQLHFRSGRLPDPWKADQVVVTEKFANANHLRVGDSITAVMNDKFARLNVVGIAMSPEFIHTMVAGLPLPDDKRFGVFWINESALAAAFDFEDAINNLTLKISPNTSRQDVIEKLDQVLEPYGSKGAYSRKDQGSHRMVSDEIRQNQTTSTIIPIIFLSVAAYLVHMVMRRLVQIQRGQIATLKALGYESSAIGLHYLRLVTAIVLIGTPLGTLLGYVAGRWIVNIYETFFMFPSLDFVFSLVFVFLGVLASLLAGFAGVSLPIRKAIVMKPAEAMRPEAPESFRHFAIERLIGLRKASPEARIAIRNFLIRPFRSLLGSLAISFAVAVVVLGVFWRDTIDYLLYVQFERSQPAEVMLSFRDPVSQRALSEIRHFPSVLAADEIRIVPAKFHAGPRLYRSEVMGIPENARFKLVLRQDLKSVAPPPGGILLGTSLARQLRVEPGDPIEVDVLEGQRPRLKTKVSGIVNEMVGINGYMQFSELNRLMREESEVSGAAVLLDGPEAQVFFRHLREVPAILSSITRKSMVRSFRETSGSITLTYAFFLTVFGIFIAVGVVYNSARIALSERAWELASLRILGFTRAEVFRILVDVPFLETVLGIPIGLITSFWLASLIIHLIQTETFSMPVVIEPRSYAAGASAVLISALVAGFILRGMVNRLDLIGVLKARE